MRRKSEITRGRDNFAFLFNKHSAIKVCGEMDATSIWGGGGGGSFTSCSHYGDAARSLRSF